MNHSHGWRRFAAGLAVSLLAIACSNTSDGAADEEADDLPDIAAEVEDPDPEPESDPDPDPEPEEPEPEPEPDPEPAQDPDAYDGFPIDQPVEDISVIDEAYVNEVLRVLDENHANLVLRMRELGIVESSQDAYVSVLRELAMTAVQGAQEELFERVIVYEADGGFQEDLEPAQSEVFELQTIRQDCIAAVISMDAQPFYAAPLDGGWFIGLEPQEVLAEEARSYWRFSGFSPNLGEELNYCDA